MPNSVDLDEAAHYEPPHQDLPCLQISLFMSLVLKVLISTTSQADVTKADVKEVHHFELPEE